MLQDNSSVGSKQGELERKEAGGRKVSWKLLNNTGQEVSLNYCGDWRNEKEGYEEHY